MLKKYLKYFGDFNQSDRYNLISDEIFQKNRAVFYLKSWQKVSVTIGILKPILGVKENLGPKLLFLSWISLYIPVGNKKSFIMVIKRNGYLQLITLTIVMSFTIKSINP